VTFNGGNEVDSVVTVGLVVEENDCFIVVAPVAALVVNDGDNDITDVGTGVVSIVIVRVVVCN
jgi:hypothetical protein